MPGHTAENPDRHLTQPSRTSIRPPGPGGRVTLKRMFKTFYGVLAEAARWMGSLGVTHVAMEATGIYSMPVYHALLEHGDF